MLILSCVFIACVLLPLALQHSSRYHPVAEHNFRAESFLVRMRSNKMADQTDCPSGRFLRK